ncbi:hypothetical protein AAK899_12290 [Erysipelotrichaceae bacterium 51-3]
MLIERFIVFSPFHGVVKASNFSWILIFLKFSLTSGSVLMVLVYGVYRSDEMTESRMLTVKNYQNFGRFEAFAIGVAEKMRGKMKGKENG